MFSRNAQSLENQTLQKKDRNSNLEILRILSMISIILFHIVSQSGTWVNNQSIINKYLSVFLGIGGRSAVICFVVIGAYFLCEQDFKSKRIFLLWFETVFYTLLITLICKYILNLDVSFSDIILCFLPISKPRVWFVSVYCGLLLISPFLNLILRKFSKRECLGLLIILFILISLLPTIIPTSNSFFSNIGVFIFVYLLTGFIKKYQIKVPKKEICLLIAVSCYIVMFALWIIIESCGLISADKLLSATDYYAGHFETLFCIGFAFSTFDFFVQLKPRTSKIVNFLSSSCLSVYIIHQTPTFYNYLWTNVFKIKSFFSCWYFGFYVIGVALIIFLFCVFVDKIRIYCLEKPLSRIPLFNVICSKIDLLLNFYPKGSAEEKNQISLLKLNNLTRGIKPDASSKKKANLKSNLVYNFISQILTLIIPLITTPYLSRILGEEGNGRISYSFSIVTVFIIFASLGFTTYGQREIAKVRDNKIETSKVFWEITILKSITTLITSAVFFTILYTSGFGKCNDLILIFSIELFSTIFDITFFFQGEENFKSLAIRMIFLKILGLILIFSFVKTSNDEWIYALCLSLSLLLSYVIMWPSLKGKISFVKLNELSFKRHIGPTLRIFVPQLAITIYSVMDKLMIGWFATNSDYENGCYEQAYKINSVALLLVTVISSVLAPRNTYDYKNGNIDSFKGHINFAIHYTWMMGLPLIAGFAILSRNLSTWYLGEGYAEVPLLMQIMSIRFVCSGISELCGNQIFIAIGKEKYYTIATCVAAVVNILLNYFFIQLWGATGAAISTAICEFLVASILATIAIKKKYFSFKDLFSCSWKYLISALVMLVTIYFIQKYLPYTIWSFVVIMLTGAIEYFLILLALRDSFLTYWLGRFINRFKKKKESTK